MVSCSTTFRHLPLLPPLVPTADPRMFGDGRYFRESSAKPNSHRRKAEAERKLAPRQHDQDEARECEHYASGDPWPLIDHEAGCRPMNKARALADPKQARQQRSDA
jgi:hypothetical protein